MQNLSCKKRPLYYGKVCLAHSFADVYKFGLILRNFPTCMSLLKLILQGLIEAKEKQMHQETIN